jgi:hypothetical protein
MEDLRVLVVSDDPLARTGLALLLADRDGIAVSGQAAADDDWPGPAREAPLQVEWSHPGRRILPSWNEFILPEAYRVERRNS